MTVTPIYIKHCRSLKHMSTVFRVSTSTSTFATLLRYQVRNAFALDLDQEFQSPNLAAALCCEAPNVARRREAGPWGILQLVSTRGVTEVKMAL